MRNRVQPIVALLVVVSGLVVAGAPVRVTTDRDPKADFSQLATYRWLPTPPYLTPHDARDPGLVQEALDEPIRAAVDRALGDKRFKRAASTKQPDFHVLYYAAFSTGMDANVLGAYYGYLTGWGSPVLATPGPPPRLDEGTLVIDILRADRAVALWRGTATGTVDRTRTKQERRRTIDTAVAQMFATFPNGR